jgi:DNA topoisomerase VI subunit B
MLSNLQNIGQNALQNTLQNVGQNIGQNPGALQTASPAASQTALPAASAEALQTASAEALPSPQALKSGIVQLMTELNNDPEFKKMIADKCTEYTYSAIDEKAGKVGQTIADLRQLHENFEKTDTSNFESLKNAFAKYNTDFNNIASNQKIVGGNRFKKSRRRSSSRAFRKTRGRRRSSQ